MTILHVLYDLTITVVWNNAKANSLDDALGSDSSQMEVELLISLIQIACGLVYLTYTTLFTLSYTACSNSAFSPIKTVQQNL